MGDIFGGITSLIGTGLEISAADAANRKNEALMREAWNREDTAVERRMRDLTRSGINPLLAAGSAATSSGPVQQQSVVKDNAGLQIVEALKGMVGADQVRAQTELLKTQQQKTSTETGGLEQEIAWNKATQEDRMIQLKNATRISNNEATLKALQTSWEAAQGETNKVSEYKNADGTYGQIDLGARTNYAMRRDSEKALAAGQAEAAKYTDDKIQQDIIAMILAAKRMGMENQILANLEKTNPGMAEGVKKWLDIITEGKRALFGK